LQSTELLALLMFLGKAGMLLFAMTISGGRTVTAMVLAGEFHRYPTIDG
jgi:hypothetical protein